MKKTTLIEGATLATLHTEIDRYCRRFGIDHVWTFEKLLDMMIHFFEWDTQSPVLRESFRNPLRSSLSSISPPLASCPLA